MTLLSLHPWQLALVFVPALLNLWGIWHAFSHRFASPPERLMWMIACVFVPALGGLAYLLIGRARALGPDKGPGAG